MKYRINTILSICSQFVATGTSWAIYAGMTKQPAFPMWPPASIAVAISIFALDATAALLVVDIMTFNKSLTASVDREAFTMSPLRAWFILILAIISEIVLSLLVVVVDGALAYGVLVFPVLTGAGVFAFAVRTDLSERERLCNEARIGRKRTPKESAPKSNPVQTHSQQKRRKCEVPGCTMDYAWPNGKGAHYKKWHPEKTLQKAYIYHGQ